MAKNKKLLQQVVMIIFLALIVIGFTIPGFLNSNGGGGDIDQGYIEPRLCQVDADCYLICEDVPKTVLCLQNLCQQNSCDQFSYYKFKEQPISFELDIVVDDGTIEKLDLEINEKDFFVKIVGDKVQLFTSGLSLNNVLEKLRIDLQAECLTVNLVKFCNNDDKFLSFLVNKNESFQYGDYAPQEGDEISISYLPRSPLE